MVLGSSPAQFFGAAGAAASGGGGGYQIERSVRLNEQDGGHLSRTFAASNRTTWTFATWFKLSSVASPYHHIFNQTNTYLTIDANGAIEINLRSAASNYFNYVNGLIRDYSAWYHLVWVLDTTRNYHKVYINGVDRGFSTSSLPPTDTQLLINSAAVHMIGKSNNDPRYFDGYMAETYFIDGLALPPTAFGAFDSNGVWQPKTLDTSPNDGTVWSDYLTSDDGSFDSSYPAINGFDNNQSTRCLTNTAINNTSYLRLNSPVALTGTLAVKCDANNEIYNDTGSPVLLGSNGTGSDNVWVNCGEVTDLTNLRIQMVSGSRAGISAISLNGTVLVDNFNQFNNGKFYSNDVTVTGGTPATYANMFDSSTSTYAQTPNGYDLVWTPATPIEFTGTVRVYQYTDYGYGQSAKWYVNGVEQSYTQSSAGWQTVTGVTSPITSMRWEARNNGSTFEWARVYAIEVDGTILTDATVGRNSFLLKYADNSSDSALGTDSSGNGCTWTVSNISAGASVYFVNNAGTSLDSYIPAGFTNTQNTNSLFTNDNNGVIVSAPSGGNWLRMKATSSSPTVKWMTYDGSAGGPTITLSVLLDGSSGYITPSVTGGGSSSDPKIGTFSVSSGTSYYIRTNLTGSLNTSMVLYVTGLEGDEASGQDSLFDSPTNGTQTNTGAGGEVSGNYATLNPNDAGSTVQLQNGNLYAICTSPHNTAVSTIQVSSGKYLAEFVWDSLETGTSGLAGVVNPIASRTSYVGGTTGGVGYNPIGHKWVDGVQTTGLTSSTLGDVIGIALDKDNNQVSFYKNGALLFTQTGLNSEQPYGFAFGHNNSSGNFNFGQRPFVHPVSGFKPLTTAVFIDPTFADGSTAMDATLYEGNGTSQVISGLGFSPDLVWIKQRSTIRDHCLCDIVRGPNLRLRSNSSYRETNESVVTAFNTNGFDIGSDAGVNQSSGTYVAWTWGGGSDYTDSTYNQSETWSTSLTAADGFYTPDNETADKAFDGRTTTYAAASITGTNNNTPLVFSKTITGITSMRIMFKGRLHLNGGSELASESGNGVWYTVSSPPSTLTQVDVYPYTQAAIGPRFYALEINGKILVDTGVNTEGSLTSSVRVNASAGFSVVTATGSASSSSTVGHGLNVAPSFIAVKLRELAGNGFDQDWQVYHSSIGNTGGLKLNTVANTETSSVIWNNTSPTSTVFSIGASSRYDGDFVAYCWAPVEGYSAFGSYTGNASINGPFVYTGFRPKWIVIKNSSASAGWYMFDEERDTYNLTTQLITANTDTQEYTDVDVRIDILSNGFKLRSSGGQCNGSTNVMVYAAFASNPFKTARAR